MTKKKLLAERRGARTPADLYDRCRIDEAGCRLWAGAVTRPKNPNASATSRVWVPDPTVMGEGEIMTALRAAWILSGRDLPPGYVVYSVKCHHSLCIWPEHAAAMTRREMYRAIADSGIRKGLPNRVIANRANMLRMAQPAAVVRQVEALLAEGTPVGRILSETGVTWSTMNKIRSGLHPRSPNVVNSVRGSSVFTLAATR